MNETRSASSHETLLAVIRQVRNRWRLKILLRGLAVFLASTAVLLLVSGWGMDRFRFGPGAILGFRLLTYAIVAWLAWRLLIQPQRRRVTDETVALYLEENEPSLDGALVTAVEAGRGAPPPARRPPPRA